MGEIEEYEDVEELIAPAMVAKIISKSLTTVHKYVQNGTINGTVIEIETEAGKRRMYHIPRRAVMEYLQGTTHPEAKKMIMEAEK